jgi:hypothetical protein
MRMMCEHYDLGTARELGQGAESGGGAAIVKLDEDVVNNQRKRLVAVKVGFKAGQAQSQVELIGGSKTQASDADHLASAAADGLEHGLVMIVVIDSEVLE